MEVEGFLKRVRDHEAADLGFTWTDDDGVSLRFLAPTMTAARRAGIFGHDEPETLAWFAETKPGEVVFDIGANIGLYSVYVAKKRRARVFAFEPSSQNFALLCRHIAENKLTGFVQPFCVALGEETKLDTLYLTFMEAGRSGNQLAEERDADFKPKKMSFRQGVAVISLDDAVGKGWLPQPNRIKMDVDGVEHLIVKGAMNVMRDPRLTAAIFEINSTLPEHAALIETMVTLGFTYDREKALSSLQHSEHHNNYVFRRPRA